MKEGEGKDGETGEVKKWREVQDNREVAFNR